MKLPALEAIYRADGIERVRLINNGIGAAVFGELAASMNLSQETLARALGLNPRTLRNRASRGQDGRAPKRLTGDETEKAFRAYRVIRQADAVLEDSDGAGEWLKAPQKTLGERTPLSLLARDVGVEEVVNLLQALEYGVYV